MQNNPTASIRVTWNLILLLLAFGLVFLLLMAIPTLMTHYFPLGQVLVPLIVFAIIAGIGYLAIQFFPQLGTLKFFLPVMIVAVPITYLAVCVTMYAPYDSPINLDHYFIHLTNQKEALAQAQTPDTSGKEIPYNIQTYAPKGYLIAKVRELPNHPHLHLVHLLKPSYLRGADDFLGLYNSQTDRLTGIVATDQMFQEIATARPLSHHREWEAFDDRDLDKGQIAFPSDDRSDLGSYVVTLSSDGTALRAEQTVFVPYAGP